ncbi:MAG TPA: A24 family peptidase [Solirubrobacterales bacterium]|nr:A24 family peptidase [Solirubrobacterales bacterium]
MSLLAAAVLIVTLTVVSVTDMRRRVIPNRVLLLAAAVGVALSALSGPAALAGDLAAAAVVSAPLFAASLLRPEEMGMGDAKLVAVIGLFLGWQALPALLIGLALAGMTGVLIALGRRLPPSRTSIPLAPFLAAGTLPMVLSTL